MGGEHKYCCSSSSTSRWLVTRGSDSRKAWAPGSARPQFQKHCSTLRQVVCGHADLTGWAGASAGDPQQHPQDPGQESRHCFIQKSQVWAGFAGPLQDESAHWAPTPDYGPSFSLEALPEFWFSELLIHSWPQRTNSCSWLPLPTLPLHFSTQNHPLWTTRYWPHTAPGSSRGPVKPHLPGRVRRGGGQVCKNKQSGREAEARYGQAQGSRRPAR